MQSKIDQSVLDELITMLEDHVAGGLKPKSDIPGAVAEAPEEEGEEVPESAPSDDMEEEDMQKLMEMYSRGK